jgi:MFS superfamily sulfate permease-like transporter
LSSSYFLAAAACCAQTHLRDFAVWLVAFLATLFLGIELGLAAAIGLALLIVIFESAFPHTAVLGRVDRTTVRGRRGGGCMAAKQRLAPAMRSSCHISMSAEAAAAAAVLGGGWGLGCCGGVHAGCIMLR